MPTNNSFAANAIASSTESTFKVGAPPISKEPKSISKFAAGANPTEEDLIATFGEENVKVFPSSGADIVNLNLEPLGSGFFIRLGSFLQFMEQNIIPKIVTSSEPQPMLLIDYHPQNNICYVVDNSISIDPRKTIISNSSFFTKQNGTQKIYPELNTFIHSVGGFIYGNIMNIYFSLDRIEDIMDDVDSNDQISVFKVLKKLSTDINISLGNINNIEPIIDKESNTIRFIDQTSIPGLDVIAASLDGYKSFDNKKDPTLEIFGYNTKEKTSNFVQKVGITTEISKEYATMITIGATANGAIPGTESTAFSKWNVGIRDRFKNELIDGESKRGDSLEKQNEGVLTKYIDFIDQDFEKLGFSKDNDKFIINPTFIGIGKSAITDYYTYAQAQTSKADPKYIESSIGFLPFNLKLTMDGISGMKIYNKVKVNTSFLPSNYGDTLSFIVTGVNHKLSGNEWVTDLNTIATTKTKQKDSNTTIKTQKILESEQEPQPSTLVNTKNKTVIVPKVTPIEGGIAATQNAITSAFD